MNKRGLLVDAFLGILTLFIASVVLRLSLDPITAFLVLAAFLVIPVLESQLKMPRLSQPPGWNLRRFAELCFSKKTFTQVLEPALSDMQKEHFDALAAGRPWQARMALVRGYWSFWSAVAAQLPISFARRIYEVWKATKTGS
jgi:hypothetical protein